jgi:hypothetical protein
MSNKPALLHSTCFRTLILPLNFISLPPFFYPFLYVSLMEILHQSAQGRALSMALGLIVAHPSSSTHFQTLSMILGLPVHGSATPLR